MVGIAQIAGVPLEAPVLKQFHSAHAEQAVLGQGRAALHGGGQREVEPAVLGQKLDAVFEHPPFVGGHVVFPHGRGDAAVVGGRHTLGDIVVGSPFHRAEPFFLGHLRGGRQDHLHCGGFLHQSCLLYTSGHPGKLAGARPLSHPGGAVSLPYCCLLYTSRCV